MWSWELEKIILKIVYSRGHEKRGHWPSSVFNYYTSCNILLFFYKIQVFIFYCGKLDPLP